MRTARTRISERNFLLVFVLTAVIGTVPTLADAVNEFPSTPPKRGTSAVQSSPTQRIYVPATPLLRAPDLIGQPVASARAALEGLGLRAGNQATQTTTDRRPGTVIGQDPKPGTPVKPGQTVNLWIAAAPPERDPRLIPGDRVRREVVVPSPRPDDVGVRPPSPPRASVVPDLSGQPTGRARELLDAAALTLGEQRRDESERPTGTVTSQTPPAGARVRPGTTVDVTVAVPLLITVPQLTGQSPEHASDLLARARLTLGERRPQPSDAPSGTVLSQSPAAGTRVRPGTGVSVVVAAPILVSVPDLTGRSAAEARQLLDRNRLGLGESRRRESEATVGSVLSQSPAARTRVPSGTSVDIVVAVARSVVVTPTAPPPPARPSITPRPEEPAPAPVTPVAVAPALAPVAQPPTASPPRAPDPASPPLVALPSAPPVTPAVEPTPRWPLRVHWGIAATLVLGAAARLIYYRAYQRGRATGGSQQSPAPSLALEFAPRWDPGRQQIGPAGPLSDGSGLRLVSRLDIGTPRLEDDHLVGAAAKNGGLPR